MLRKNVAEKIKINIYFYNILSVWDIAEKCWQAGQNTDGNIIGRMMDN